MRIRTDDIVQVISGKEKGKQGKVLRTEPKSGTVYVESINMIKRHQRAQPSPDGRGQGKEGGIIEMEGPVHVSNVALVDPTDSKPTRIGVRITDEGLRQRYSKRTGEAI